MAQKRPGETEGLKGPAMGSQGEEPGAGLSPRGVPILGHLPLSRAGLLAWLGTEEAPETLHALSRSAELAAVPGLLHPAPAPAPGMLCAHHRGPVGAMTAQGLVLGGSVCH